MGSIFRKIAKACKDFFLPKDDFKTKSASKEASVYKATPAARQKMLEDACDALFDRQDLIVSGKLQMLGIQQIKQKYAERWPYIQQEVFSIIVSILKEHLAPQDIFFRYKEEGYIVLFAKQDQEDAHATLTAIAFAIRQALLESEEEAVQDVKISKSMGHIYTKQIKNSISPDSLADAFEETPESKEQRIIKIEIDNNTAQKAAPAPQTSEQPLDARINKINHCYIPIFSPTSPEKANHYLLVAQGKSAGDNPLDKHQMFFLGMGNAEKHDYDLAFLQITSFTLLHQFKESLNYQIICPLHFETLSNVKAFEKYIIECQKIPEAQKQKVIFCIQNFPSEFNPTVIKKSLNQLRPHCATIAAIIQNYKTLDLDTFTNVGVNIAGFRIKNSAMMAEGKLLDTLQDFSGKLKKNRVQHILALDFPKPDLLDTPQALEFNYLSGEEILPHRKNLS